MKRNKERVLNARFPSDGYLCLLFAPVFCEQFFAIWNTRPLFTLGDPSFTPFTVSAKNDEYPQSLLCKRFSILLMKNKEEGSSVYLSSKNAPPCLSSCNEVTGLNCTTKYEWNTLVPRRNVRLRLASSYIYKKSHWPYKYCICIPFLQACGNTYIQYVRVTE
jgi:hypothetical protein